MLRYENTRKTNESPASLLKAYWREKIPMNFPLCSRKQLNNVVVQFHVNVQQVNGQKYKISSQDNLQHGLNSFPIESPTRENL